MSLPKKTREWWNYLRHLNEVIDHSQVVFLRASLGVNDVAESLPFKVSSAHDFFAFSILGACEFVASPPQAGEIMDPSYRNPYQITVRLPMDIPECDLIENGPIMLAQLCGPALSTFDPIDLPHPIRIQHDATIKAIFESTPNLVIPGEREKLEVCVVLMGQRVKQAALSYASVRGAEIGR